MTARKILFWVHLCIGVTAGLVILTMSVTGVILAFERQIITRADRGYQIHPASDERRLPLDAVLAKVQAMQGSAPSGIVVRSDPTLPIEFSFGRERTVLASPYTGEILSGASHIRSFFGQVENIHRWLAMPLAKREWGQGITGACNLAFLGLVLSGPFLWWPKAWTWTNVKKILLFRTGPSLRTTMWNWHNVFGIWCAVPLFFIVLTGVVMSYTWANNLLYRVMGNDPPVPQSRSVTVQRPGEGSRQRAGHDEAGDSKVHSLPLDDLFARAEKEAPGWKSVGLRMTGPTHGPITLSVDTGSGGRADLRSQITLNSTTGEFIRIERFESYNLARRLRTWGRFTHTGEAGGWIGQLIAAMAAAGASILVLTGLWLAIRRFILWRNRTAI